MQGGQAAGRPGPGEVTPLERLDAFTTITSTRLPNKPHKKIENQAGGESPDNGLELSRPDLLG